MFFRNKLWLLFFLIISIPRGLLAQGDVYTFKQISYEQGLPGVNVRNVFQDSHGVMWIAVEAMGVCKYYGNKFTHYKNNPKDTTSLSSNYTNSVLEDSKGNIWIATDKGLNRYDRRLDIFIRYFHSSEDNASLPDNAVNTLSISRSGNFWICTGNGLSLYNYEKDNFANFLHEGNPQLNDVWNMKDIYEDDHGFLWLGTNKGLLKFSPETKIFKSWEKSTHGELANDLINCLAIDEDKVLWMGTHRGINKFDLKTEKFIPWKYQRRHREELRDEGVNHIFNDRQGSLWVGTYTKGIVRINPENNSYSRITNTDPQNHGLKSNHIKYIFKDKDSAIWVATKFEGLFLHDPNKMIFSNWPEKYDLFLNIKDKHILDVFSDWKYEETYWVATKFDGLYRIDLIHKSIKNYRHRPGKPTTINSNRIHTITRDKEGNLFVGSENGLDHFVEEAQEFDHISDIPIDEMEADDRGNLWIGCNNGIYVFNKAEGVVRRHRSQHNFFKSNFEIRYIFKDKENKLWIATDHSGLFLYDSRRDQLTRFLNDANDPGNISDNMIRPVFEDSKGDIWIGTKTNGLNKYDRQKGTFTHFTTNDGLPTNFILSIEEDRNGNLWLGTHNGLSKFNTSQNSFTSYNKEYGLQNNIFEIGVSSRFEDGKLLFGGHNGFNIFNPDSIQHEKAIPQIIISSVKILDKEIKRDVVAHEKLILNYRENYLSFEFGLTDYVNSSKHQFAYKLDGVDEGWNYAGSRNYVSYSSLAPGNYTLRIKGANELGIWNNEGISIGVIIHPPFYNTTFFKSTGVISLFLFAFIFYRVKSRKDRKTKLFLETKIKERTQELQNALKELKEHQNKIESQNEELSTHYKKILSQNNHIQQINSELQKAHKDLQSINSELDQRVKDRTEKLLKANQELDRFVYSASHDLSAPLKSILGLINIAKFENTDKSMFNNLEYMERSVTKLEEVIKSLTQFSRNMGHDVKKSNILFDEVVEDILTESRVAYKVSEFELVKDYNPRTMIFSDYLRIRIILTNLISNAFKYKKPGHPKPFIKISLIKEEDHYVIKIMDKGMGISEENQKKVFEMFYRATSESEGSGLGLYIVTETLAKLSGAIELRSQLTEFTEFTVKIPLLDQFPM